MSVKFVAKLTILLTIPYIQVAFDKKKKFTTGVISEK